MAKFDLEDRTLRFAKAVIDLCKILGKDLVNREIVSQLLRASGSVGANYREANEASTKRDFLHKIGLCRKEAKESKYWLELALHANSTNSKVLDPLIDEAMQLTRIFAAIANKR